MMMSTKVEQIVTAAHTIAEPLVCFCNLCFVRFITADKLWFTFDEVLCRSSYESAPVFALMERVVLSKMREYVGWMDGEGDGILAPGQRKTYPRIHRPVSRLCSYGGS